jgi:hypothetical protein
MTSLQASSSSRGFTEQRCQGRLLGHGRIIQRSPHVPAGAANGGQSRSHPAPDQAEAIALRVVAGLDMARVASIMGKRPGTVRGLAHHGLRGLAERLSTGGRIRGTV